MRYAAPSLRGVEPGGPRVDALEAHQSQDRLARVVLRLEVLPRLAGLGVALADELAALPLLVDQVAAEAAQQLEVAPVPGRLEVLDQGDDRQRDAAELDLVVVDHRGQLLLRVAEGRGGLQEVGEGALGGGPQLLVLRHPVELEHGIRRPGVANHVVGLGDPVLVWGVAIEEAPVAHDRARQVGAGGARRVEQALGREVRLDAMPAIERIEGLAVVEVAGGGEARDPGIPRRHHRLRPRHGRALAQAGVHRRRRQPALTRYHAAGEHLLGQKSDAALLAESDALEAGGSTDVGGRAELQGRLARGRRCRA